VLDPVDAGGDPGLDGGQGMGVRGDREAEAVRFLDHHA
jgi:hypothetical protein